MTEQSKPRKDFAIHLNQVHMLGRVVGEPKKRGDEKVSVSLIVPTYKKGGGKQWIPFAIDVVGEHRKGALELTPGDYMGCTCRFAERGGLTDDNGDKKSVKVLQIDPFRDVVFMPGDAGDDVLNPPFDVCFTRVVMAGRNFIRKKQIEEGSDTPILREGDNGKYCFVNMRYEDPYQKMPEEGWPKSLFLDFAVSGAVAERVSEFCRNRAQLIVFGELGKKELDFTISGKTPKEPKINVLPGGLTFMNMDFQSGTAKKQEATEEYKDGDSEGIDGLDGDLPF